MADYERERAEATNAFLIGYIPYENIESVNWEGDEHYQFPQIYCHFAHGGEPYERTAYCERKKIHSDWYYFSELESFEKVKLTSQKYGTS